MLFLRISLKEIFWPDVPLFLKFPLPIMQMIEVFGIFTKPAALCVRLFANMMGGHITTIRPTRFIVRMKKKQVRRYGANLFVLSPSVLLIVS